MSKRTLEQRLAEVDKRHGLTVEDDDATVEERKRKEKEEAEEVREVILREGVTAVFDRDTGNAYVTLDEAELSLDDRLNEVDRRHGLRAQRLG